MGTLSVTKADHLLWLGRYVERTYTTLRFILHAYDKALDDPLGNWRDQLEELGFREEEENPYTFVHDCLFSPTLPSSIRHSISAAYDNAVTLRDRVGTEAIAYVQMAYDSVGAAETSDSPLIDLQSVVDDIMAFRGCIDDYIADDAVRSIIKVGMGIERIDLYTRLDYQLERLPQEVHRLASRINRTGIAYDQESFRGVVDMVFDPEFPGNMSYDRLGELLKLDAHIFG